MGCSCGELTTKIVARVDALDNLVRFLLLPGQTHESKVVAPRISNLPFGALLTDKVFHSNGLFKELPVRGATVVIPPRRTQESALLRQGSLQVAPSDREFPCQNQGIPGHCHRLRQNRQQRCRPLEPVATLLPSWYIPFVHRPQVAVEKVLRNGRFPLVVENNCQELLSTASLFTVKQLVKLHSLNRA